MYVNERACASRCNAISCFSLMPYLCKKVHILRRLANLDIQVCVLDIPKITSRSKIRRGCSISTIISLDLHMPILKVWLSLTRRLDFILDLARRTLFPHPCDACIFGLNTFFSICCLHNKKASLAVCVQRKGNSDIVEHQR